MRLTDCDACASQAADINALFGFRIECIERLGDRNGLWAWTRLNSLFNWLPLAACIEDKVLCMHGGELVALPFRPLVYILGHQLERSCGRLLL